VLRSRTGGAAGGAKTLYPCGAEPGTGRAKVSPKPWNWERSHETGCCYPVGASRYGSNPTGLKPRQQVRSEPACVSARGGYGAGCSEDAGRVMEPRNT